MREVNRSDNFWSEHCGVLFKDVKGLRKEEHLCLIREKPDLDESNVVCSTHNRSVIQIVEHVHFLWIEDAVIDIAEVKLFQIIVLRHCKLDSGKHNHLIQFELNGSLDCVNVLLQRQLDWQVNIWNVDCWAYFGN